jgi:hypothetical protein
MKIIAMLIALLLFQPATAQRKPRTETPAIPVITQGISYSLPQTGIRVVVNARQSVFIPGPYAAYADQLLGIRDAKIQPQTIWEIVSVSVETFSEPDPVNTFKAIGGAAAFLQLTPAGVLAGINGDSNPESSIRTVSNSYASKISPEYPAFTNLFDTPGLSGRTSPDQRAVHAANRILKSRNTRFEIAAGLLDEFHPDGDAYKKSIEELRNIENEILALFTGKTMSENHTFSFDFIPQGPVRGEVIFRFDETRGILPKSDLSGKPVMIDVDKDEELAARIGAVQSSQLIPADRGGIFYRQPGMADIRIMRELTLIATGRAVVAQFGGISPLPAELTDGSYAVQFHTETGALQSVRKK